MNYLQDILSRFARDERATITIEYIFVAPLLVIWWVGSVTFYGAFDSQAGAARVSYVIADLVSRQTEINTSYIDSLQLLQTRMRPRDPVGTVRVSQIHRDSAGDLSVDWSYSSTGQTSDVLTDADIPTDIMPILKNDAYILLIDTAIPYNPLSDSVGIGARTWENRIFTQARFTDRIASLDF